MKTYLPFKGASPIKLWGDDLPPKVDDQLTALASLPFIHHHIASMPDRHWGNGTAIGTVLATTSALIPSAVGVDIGCGMTAVRLGATAEDLPDNLTPLQHAIETAVPHGRTDNGGPNDKGAWPETPADIIPYWARLSRTSDWEALKLAHPAIKDKVTTHRHLGTLGSGNHFIELCLDEGGRLWVMLHSGSRGIGNRIGTYFISLAKKDMERWFIHLPDTALAYIPEGSPNFADYVRAVHWAQEYAAVNRQLILQQTLKALAPFFPTGLFVTDEVIQCHHNYVARENHYGKNVWITRKGAIQAREGTLGIIPGSMGTASYIVRGKGNPASFHSCSHGAGRKMSRGEARRTFTEADLRAQTSGIACPKDASRVDEIPAAYKDLGEVMKAQEDLVEVVHTLRQVVNVKG